MGHDDFRSRDLFFLVDIHGNAAAIVAHCARTVGVDPDLDPVAIAAESFIDRVVDNLINHVVKAGPVIGVADIHARPFADGF